MSLQGKSLDGGKITWVGIIICFLCLIYFVSKHLLPDLLDLHDLLGIHHMLEISKYTFL